MHPHALATGSSVIGGGDLASGGISSISGIAATLEHVPEG